MLHDGLSQPLNQGRSIVRSAFFIGFLVIPSISYAIQIWLLLGLIIIFAVLQYINNNTLIQLSQNNQHKGVKQLIEQAFPQNQFYGKLYQFSFWVLRIGQLCVMHMVLLQFLQSIITSKQNLHIYANLILCPIYFFLAIPKNNHYYTHLASGLKQFIFYMTAFSIYMLYWSKRKTNYNQDFSFNIQILEAVNILSFAIFSPVLFEELSSISERFLNHEVTDILFHLGRDIVIYLSIISIPGGTLVEKGQPLFMISTGIVDSQPIKYLIASFVLIFAVVIPYQTIFLRDKIFKEMNIKVSIRPKIKDLQLLQDPEQNQNEQEQQNQNENENNDNLNENLINNINNNNENQELQQQQQQNNPNMKNFQVIEDIKNVWKPAEKKEFTNQLIFNGICCLIILGTGFLYKYYFLFINALGMVCTIYTFSLPYLLESNLVPGNSNKIIGYLFGAISLGSLGVGFYYQVAARPEQIQS